MAYRINFFSKTKKKNKYNAKKQQYHGKKYDSNFEAKYAEELDWRVKIGEVLEVQRQVPITITVNGVFISTYYCDFRIVLADGTIQYHEVKGMVLPLWQMKWRLVNALKDELLEPGAELIVIK